MNTDASSFKDKNHLSATPFLITLALLLGLAFFLTANFKAIAPKTVPIPMNEFSAVRAKAMLLVPYINKSQPTAVILITASLSIAIVFMPIVYVLEQMVGYLMSLGQMLKVLIRPYLLNSSLKAKLKY